MTDQRGFVDRQGEQALDLAAVELPDLVVLDLMLPKVDGLEVCRRIREFSLVPVVMLTARGEESGSPSYLAQNLTQDLAQSGRTDALQITVAPMAVARKNGIAKSKASASNSGVNRPCQK